MDISETAALYGLASTALSVTIPALLWGFVLRRWAPTSRFGYAFKLTLWPLLLFSFYLGGPLFRELIGFESRYTMTLADAGKGVFALWCVGAFLLFPIGWWRGKNLKSKPASP